MSATSAPQTTRDLGRSSRRLRRWLALSPDVLAPAVAVYGVTAILCALIRLPGWLAVVACFVAAFVACRYLGAPRIRADKTSDRDVSIVVSVWLGATAFAIFCCVTAGQWFVVERDPGFYSTTAKWFGSHNAFPLDAGTADMTRAVHGLTGAGYAYVQIWPGSILSQGGPLLPIMLGHFQHIFGPMGLMWGNAILTGLALVTLFAWARRFLPGWWAVVPSLLMAIALPTLYVARSAFSEGITMILLFGGLALLTKALSNADSRLAVLAAATMGATTFARLDGVAVGGLVAVLAVGIWVVASDHEPGPVRDVAYGVALHAVAVPIVAICVYSVTTPEYLYRLRWETLSEAVGLVIGAFLVTRLANNVITVRGWISERTKTHKDVVYSTVTWVFTAAFLFLTSRPLWEKVRLTLDLKDGYQHEVALVQIMNGQTPDQARTYDELTTVSTAWYFGWFLLAMSVVGLVWFAVRSRLEDRDAWTPILGSFGVLLPLYFWAWHITPDQLWASRHLLMLGYPVLILLATFTASRITSLLPRRGFSIVLRAAVAAALITGFILPTATTTQPVALVHQYDGIGTMLDSTCALIAKKTVDRDHTFVLITGGYAGSLQTTLRMFCDVPVVRTEDFAGPKAQKAIDELKVWAAKTGWHMISVNVEPSVPSSIVIDSVINQTTPLYWRTLDSAPNKTFDKSYRVTVVSLGS